MIFINVNLIVLIILIIASINIYPDGLGNSMVIVPFIGLLDRDMW